MVTMTVYVDVQVFCFIVNTLNHVDTFDVENAIKEVSLKRKRKYPLEIQVPIQIVGSFVKKDMTKIDLNELKYLAKKNERAL